MTCKTIQQWILLRKQGEGQTDGRAAEQRTSHVCGKRARQIQAHLTGCKSCRQWLEDYQKIGALTETALPSGEPSAKVLINVLREARVHAPEPRTQSNRPLGQLVLRLVHVSALRPSLALATAAAVCLMLVGGWLLRPTPDVLVGDSQLSTILLMLAEETDEDLSDASVSATSAEAESLEALAQELLALQGLDADYTDLELSTPSEAHQATDPLTRSSAASRSERYG